MAAPLTEIMTSRICRQFHHRKSLIRVNSFKTMKLNDSGAKEYFYFLKIKCVHCVVFAVVAKTTHNDDR